MVQNKPGSRDQEEEERQYYSGKEALGKLGNIQFSGHNPKRLCLALECLGKEPHSSVLNKLLTWLSRLKRTFPEIAMQE